MDVGKRDVVTAKKVRNRPARASSIEARSHAARWRNQLPPVAVGPRGCAELQEKAREAHLGKLVLIHSAH